MKLQKEIYAPIIWGTPEQTLKYVNEHDWVGDFFDTKLVTRFQVAARAVL